MPMTERLRNIRKQLERGDTDRVIKTLDSFIRNHPSPGDESFYLLGNAYRKKGDWQRAMNCYLEAAARNPESPAVAAKEMLTAILDFRCKDLYNQ